VNQETKFQQQVADLSAQLENKEADARQLQARLAESERSAQRDACALDSKFFIPSFLFFLRLPLISYYAIEAYIS